MGDWLLALFNAIQLGFQEVLNFFYNGLVSILREFCLFWLYLSKEWFFIRFDVLLSLVDELFDKFFTQFNLKNDILDLWHLIPSNIKSLFVYFKIPEMLSVIFSAYAVRFLRSLIPFM